MDKKIKIIKIVVDNFAVSVAMSLTASFLAQTFDIYTLICIPFSFVISLLLTKFIPWNRMSNWFGSLFKLKENTLSCNLVGGLFTNIFFNAIISLSCKLLIFLPDINEVLNVFITTYIPTYVVSYIVYQGTFYTTNKLFKNKRGNGD